ncbi:MAG TPA: YcxB family protein [Solimonas sp.]|nr:YcxB family protein [Solimonas sp.]
MTDPGPGPAFAPLRAQGCISESDYVSAQFLHLRPVPPLLWLFVAVAIGLLVTMAVMQSVPLLAAASALAGYVLLVMPLRARRAYRRNPSIATPQTMDVQDDGLVFQRARGPQLLRWNQLQRWRMNRRLVLLYPSGKGFYLVPAALFPNEADFAAFTARLRQHAGDPE